MQFIPPYAINYQEGELEVDVTCDAVKPHLDLLHGSASAFRAGQFVHLSSSEDHRIFENITTALEWKGYISYLCHLTCGQSTIGYGILLGKMNSHLLSDREMVTNVSEHISKSGAFIALLLRQRDPGLFPLTRK